MLEQSGDSAYAKGEESCELAVHPVWQLPDGIDDADGEKLRDDFDDAELDLEEAPSEEDEDEEDEEDDDEFDEDYLLEETDGDSQALYSNADASGPLEEEGDIFVAVCDKCGATHLTDIDFINLGLQFICSHIGLECEGAEDSASSSTAMLPGDSTPQAPPRAAKLEALTAEEKQNLFDRHAMQLQEAKLKPKEILKGVKQLYDKQMPKERFRDSEIVTRKGERFIKINVSLDPGPGCQIGGILGWRSKQGRRGLGIQKMTKEEADRICLSNKNRSHETKQSGSGGHKKSYSFENKWSQHTFESSQ